MAIHASALQYILCITPCFIMCSWLKHVFHWLLTNVHHVFQWRNKLNYIRRYPIVVYCSYISGCWNSGKSTVHRSISSIPSRGFLNGIPVFSEKDAFRSIPNRGFLQLIHWDSGFSHATPLSPAPGACGAGRVPSGPQRERCHGHQWEPGLHLAGDAGGMGSLVWFPGAS